MQMLKQKHKVMFLVIAALMSCMLMSGAAHATSPVEYFTYADRITVYYCTNQWYYTIDMEDICDGGSVVKVTSSNPDVVSCSHPDYWETGVWFSPKKTGSATLKIRVKKAGKAKTYKTTINVLKYKKPFSSFKIGGKKINVKSGIVNRYANVKSLPKNAKIVVKLKKGWTLKATYYNAKKDKSVTKKIKSGTVLNASNRYRSFEFYNKELNLKDTVHIIY